jgi:hypothetical protein
LKEFDGDTGYDIFIKFQDPPEPGNCYRIKAHTSTLPTDSIAGQRFLLFEDKLTSGNEITYRIRGGRKNLQAGDTITVQLLSIDRATYDYFKTLGNILASDRSPSSLSPANPNTNPSNGSLGYFAAFAVDSMKIILK